MKSNGTPERAGAEETSHLVSASIPWGPVLTEHSRCPESAEFWRTHAVWEFSELV